MNQSLTKKVLKQILAMRPIHVCIVAASTVLLALVMHYTHVMSPIRTFTDTKIEYNTAYKDDVEQYIVRLYDDEEDADGAQYQVEDEGGFVYLLAPAPENLELNFISNSELLLFALIIPNYEKHCQLDQQGKAKLVVNNIPDGTQDATGLENIILELDRPHYVRVSNNVNLKMVDPDGGRCGKVTIELQEQQRSRYFVIAFILFWVSLALIFGILKSNPLYVLAGVTSHIVFIYANRSIDVFATDNFIYSLISSTGLLGVLLICVSLPIWRWLKTLITSSIFIAALILPILFIGFYAVYGKGINEDSVHAVLQSNQRQALEFWLVTVSTKMNLTLLGFVGLVLITFHLSYKAIANRATTLLLGLLLVTVISALQWKTFIDKTPVVSVTHTAVNQYFTELSTYKEVSDERIQNLVEVGASTDKENQSLVVVIGETASKHHMSSFGYGRKTTPKMDQLIETGDIIRFNGAFSNHVHSNPTISRALTQANNYNGLTWVGAPSIVNVANAAGLKTSWVSNKPMFGVWDNHMNVIGNESQSVTFINRRVGIAKLSNEYDESLLPLVTEALTEEDNNEMVFMHLQGSHQAYCHRSPQEFKVFTGAGERYVFGNFFENHPAVVLNTVSINCYDSAIRYTDYVLSLLHDYLITRTKATAMIYIPDHGESVMDNRGHNLHEFDFHMIEIPMLFWANQAWKDKNPQRWENLQANINKVFTNDFMFEFVTGLAGIESSVIESKNDLSSSDYEEVPIPKTLHGRVAINAPDNSNYWQRQNARSLFENNKNEQIVISQVNTITKAGHLLSDGITGLEIDIHFDESSEDGQFLVGSEAELMADINLHDFLAKLDHRKVQSLWLNVKSLPSGNVTSMLSRLNMLDQIFNLQQKLVLRLPAASAEFKQLSQEGYRLAYSPEVQGDSGMVDRVVQLAGNIDASIISVPAEYYSLFESADLQGLTVRFDHIEEIKLSTPNLLETLNAKPYFNEIHVQGVSLQAKSRFDFEKNRYE